MPPLEGSGDWKGLARAVGRLGRSHFELARLEIAADTRRFAWDSGRLLAAAALAGLGWLLLAAAFAVRLGASIGLAPALAWTGLAHLSIGAIGWAWLRRRRTGDGAAPLRSTRVELAKDRSALQSARDAETARAASRGAS